jgi:hypothetical protein
MSGVRHSGWAVLAAIAALVTAGPAAAAEGIDCIADLINDDRRAEMFAAYRADTRPSEPVQAALRSALQTCTDINGWNNAAQEQARRYSLARIFHGELLRASPFSPEQLALVDTVIDATDAATVSGWLEDGLGDEEGIALAIRLVAAGVALTESNSGFIGEYVASRQAMRSSRAAFLAL